MMLALFAVGFLQAAPAPAAPNPSLNQARAQVEDFEYAGALRSLDLAWAQVGNDRETILAILELQGIVWGNLNKGPRARAAFLTLLTLDPQRNLSGDHPPRVRTPFYEAKEIVNQSGALTLTRAPLNKQADQISSVAVAVTHDSLKLTRSVRFHLQVGDQQRVASVVPDPSGNALVPTVATEVRWWVELLGDKDAVLIVLGSQSQPLVDSAIAPPQPPPVPLVEATMPPAVGQSPASAPAWLRPTGIGLGAGAAVAGGIGAYFAVTSTSARSQLTNATRDGTGAITSLTQVQAAAADQRARDSAVIANTLFVAAGGLLGLGVVLFLVGGHDDVAVTPTGTGVTVSGRF